MIEARRLSLVLCLCGVCIGSPRVLAGQRRAPGSGMPLPTIEFAQDERVERLERWLKAVARHMPGEEDQAMTDTAGWTNGNLRDLRIDVNVLVQIMRGRGASGFSVPAEGQATATQIRYTPSQLRRLHELGCAAGGGLFDAACTALKTGDRLDAEFRQLAMLAHASKVRGDDNYIVRRGALLHGDIAMLAPLSMDIPGDVRASGGLERFRMTISDGREIGLYQSAVHWEIARMLLDFVVSKGGSRAAPERDGMVRQWYRATAAWMQLREDHDRLHLDRARALFPADSDILFLSACQREVFAGAAIQTAVRSAVLPTGVTLNVGSDRAELREAEALFRRALEIKPDHAEARVRYGRVLGLMGKYPESALELRRAVADLTDQQMLYYAGLFLGAAEEALGNRDAARVSFEQAAALFPRAQSPLLALSQLARRHGDRGGALRAIDRLFALPDEDRSEHDDPWWWYYMAQARDADDLLEAMRQPYLSERLP